jgi:hypothetical protein
MFPPSDDQRKEPPEGPRPPDFSAGQRAGYGPEAGSSQDPSVFSEPWMQSGFFTPAPDDRLDLEEPPKLVSQEELAENSVWDEPSTSAMLAGPTDSGAVTWFRFYLQQVARTPVQWTWLVTLGILILAGPLAILGTLISAAGYNAWLVMVVMGPTIEEILKVALPLWVVERRPWLFSSTWQIFLCCAGAGLVFAFIENLIYLNYYFPNPSDLLILWRWTVCVLLHTGCSTVASLGLITIYRRMQSRGTRPQLIDGSNWIMAAIVLHGAYNFFAILINGWFQ